MLKKAKNQGARQFLSQLSSLRAQRSNDVSPCGSTLWDCWDEAVGEAMEDFAGVVNN